MVVQLLADLGFAMGVDRNAEGDALPFVPLYERHIDTYLGGCLQVQPFLMDLQRAIDAHLHDTAPAAAWGWKNPRSIYLLPIWDALWPGMAYIHVVRDGMAMATSANQAQLRKHGMRVLPPHLQHLPPSQCSLLLWSIVNTAAADHGAHMPGRYLQLRYEAMCEAPQLALNELAHFLGQPDGAACSVTVAPRRTRDAGICLPDDPEAAWITREALERFAYPC